MYDGSNLPGYGSRSHMGQFGLVVFDVGSCGSNRKLKESRVIYCMRWSTLAFVDVRCWCLVNCARELFVHDVREQERSVFRMPMNYS